MSSDGSWILTTSKDSIYLHSTGYSRRGFAGGPVKICNREDMAQHNIGSVSFTPASFNKFTLNNKTDNYIISSTGNHLLLWNFTKILEGEAPVCEVKQLTDPAAHCQFQINHEDRILVTGKSEVGLMTDLKSKKSNLLN